MKTKRSCLKCSKEFENDQYSDFRCCQGCRQDGAVFSGYFKNTAGTKRKTAVPRKD